jgi:addiction module HigA family antidote
MEKQPVSPGTMLKTMLEKHRLNGRKLAVAINSNPTTIYLILNDKCKITVQIAFKLGKFFGIKPENFLLLQLQYDAAKAKTNKRLMKAVAAITEIQKLSVPEKKAAKSAKGKAAPKRGRKAR